VSLLTKALQVKSKPNKRKSTPDELELAVAYFRGEVTARQVASVLGFDPRGSTAMVKMSAILRRGIFNGSVQIKLVVK